MNASKLKWISWQHSCVLELHGGLGFKDFESFNLACLENQCWRLIHNPSSLYAKVLKALYFPLVSFWEAGYKWDSS